MVSHRALQDRIACFERVEECAQRNRASDLELHFVVNARQVSQMIGKDDADHVGEERGVHATSA